MSQLNINTLATQSGSVIYLSSHISGSSISTGSFGRVETDNLTVGGSQGSDGQVLTSTGGGVGWEDAAGGVDGIVSTANSTAITINSNENVGIGVTPMTWEGFEMGGNFYGARALQIGDLGGLWYNIDMMSQEASFHLSENVYVNEYGPSYIDVAPATDYEQKAGVHRFRVAGMNPTPNELIYWTTAMTIANDGDITGTHGDYHVSSDERLKKDIVTIPDALDKVLALRGVNFKWKNKEDTNLMMGMIAQEVESVIPEVVHAQDDEMETKAVEYQFIVGVLIEAVKELSAKVEALENA
jgi:hypothetical protein